MKEIKDIRDAHSVIAAINTVLATLRLPLQQNACLPLSASLPLMTRQVIQKATLITSVGGVMETSESSGGLCGYSTLGTCGRQLFARCLGCMLYIILTLVYII